MGLIDKIKSGLHLDSDKISDTAGKLLEKSEKLGTEGLEKTKEILSSVGNKASELTTIAQLKLELTQLPKELDAAYNELGEMTLKLLSQNVFKNDHPDFVEKLENASSLYDLIQQKQSAYDELRKSYSENYVINQLNDDLVSANGGIEKAIISESSNVVGKSLKEILLPKEALISAIKRGHQMIIPDGNTRLNTGDQVIVIGKKDDVEKVVKRLSAS